MQDKNHVLRIKDLCRRINKHEHSTLSCYVLVVGLASRVTPINTNMASEDDHY
jgi:hypothetical protein